MIFIGLESPRARQQNSLKSEISRYFIERIRTVCKHLRVKEIQNTLPMSWLNPKSFHCELCSVNCEFKNLPRFYSCLGRFLTILFSCCQALQSVVLPCKADTHPCHRYQCEAFRPRIWDSQDHLSSCQSGRRCQQPLLRTPPQP